MKIDLLTQFELLWNVFWNLHHLITSFIAEKQSRRHSEPARSRVINKFDDKIPPRTESSRDKNNIKRSYQTSSHRERSLKCRKIIWKTQFYSLIKVRQRRLLLDWLLTKVFNWFLLFFRSKNTQNPTALKTRSVPFPDVHLNCTTPR